MFYYVTLSYYDDYDSDAPGRWEFDKKYDVITPSFKKFIETLKSNSSFVTLPHKVGIVASPDDVYGVFPETRLHSLSNDEISTIRNEMYLGPQTQFV